MIPKRMQDSFVSFVSIFDEPEASDGAWQAMIEDACETFMEDNHIEGDTNDAFHLYLDLRYP